MEADTVPEVSRDTFPARTRTAAGDVDGIPTCVMAVDFADKILVTISQSGRLAQWVHVPLAAADPDLSSQRSASAADPSYGEDGEDDGDAVGKDPGLLPMTHLTATTVLGGTVPEREVAGQLCVTQIASAIVTKEPEEQRLLVVGLGLEKARLERGAFMEILGLVLGCL
ncbi:hypothetical protein BDY21DRAFT_383251 [Lineolata rhizophorae]|uniref:Proteasome assembly chaperone 3 n=1 Tax=Lineolata rhizophorae TaxID=578093 RepID=A0A6A6PEQ2_9PEZI|nr:hypothetical protein BDY21DRAFT_383251 [Lineolata rhizophorae]